MGGYMAPESAGQRNKHTQSDNDPIADLTDPAGQGAPAI